MWGRPREHPGRRPKDRATSQLLRQPVSGDLRSVGGAKKNIPISKPQCGTTTVNRHHVREGDAMLPFCQIKSLPECLPCKFFSQRPLMQLVDLGHPGAMSGRAHLESPSLPPSPLAPCMDGDVMNARLFEANIRGFEFDCFEKHGELLRF